MRESWPWMWAGDRPQAGMRMAMMSGRNFMASRDGFGRGDDGDGGGDLGVDESHVEGAEFLGFSGLDEFVDDAGVFVDLGAAGGGVAAFDGDVFEGDGAGVGDLEGGGHDAAEAAFFPLEVIDDEGGGKAGVFGAGLFDLVGDFADAVEASNKTPADEEGNEEEDGEDDEGGFAASTFDDYGLGRIHGRGSH